MKFLKLTDIYGKEFYLDASKIITLEKSIHNRGENRILQRTVIDIGSELRFHVREDILDILKKLEE